MQQPTAQTVGMGLLALGVSALVLAAMRGGEDVGELSQVEPTASPSFTLTASATPSPEPTTAAPTPTPTSAAPTATAVLPVAPTTRTAAPTPTPRRTRTTAPPRTAAPKTTAPRPTTAGPAPSRPGPGLTISVSHSPAQPVVGQQVTVSVRVRDTDGAWVTVELDWGDGQTAARARQPACSSSNTARPSDETVTFTHAYANSGSYPVRVYVVSGGAASCPTAPASESRDNDASPHVITVTSGGR